MKEKKRSLWNVIESVEGDKVIWIIVLFLILFSIVCIFSSTSRLAMMGDATSRLDILKGQLFIVAAGLALILICYNIKNLNFFRTASRYGFVISLVLLVFLDLHLKLGPIKAIQFNGAWRAISVFGFQLHVFEVVKVAMVMYLAWAIDAYHKKELKLKVSDLWKRIIYIYAPFLLVTVLVLPGSNSSAVFIGGVLFVTILLGEINWKEMLLLLMTGIVALGACVGVYFATSNTAHPMFKRIGTGLARFDNTDWEAIYSDPASTREMKQEAVDHLSQSYSALIAVKEGGLFGKGPGQSTQRIVVPDYSEDYMFSFIVEEYGVFIGLFVVFLYVTLLARASIVVRCCGKETFAKLAVTGLSILISGQAMLHILVNCDIGVMTGQTLPMVSHGNSAFICFSIAFGIMLAMSRIASRRIDQQTRKAESLMTPTGGSVSADTAQDDNDDDIIDEEDGDSYDNEL